MQNKYFIIRSFDNSSEDYQAVIAIWDKTWPNLHGYADNLQKTDEKRPSNAPIERHIALSGDKIIAYGDIRQMLEAEDRHTYYLTLNVHPEYRSRGIGGALFNVLLDRLHKKKARQVITDTFDTYSQSIDFLSRRGFSEFMRYPHSTLDVTRFDPSRFSTSTQKIEAMDIQIKPIRLIQKCDPSWLEKLWKLDTAILKDTPSPVEEKLLTLEEFEERKIHSTWFNPHAWFIAMDGDQWVGESALETQPGVKNRYWTYITGVVTSHRRRGIATALKLQVIAFAKISGAKYIQTSNEAHNPMYNINMLLGFTPEPTEVLFRRYLG